MKNKATLIDTGWMTFKPAPKYSVFTDELWYCCSVAIDGTTEFKLLLNDVYIYSINMTLSIFMSLHQYSISRVLYAINEWAIWFALKAHEWELWRCVDSLNRIEKKNRTRALVKKEIESVHVCETNLYILLCAGKKIMNFIEKKSK